jgi:hypothetical protein
MDTAPAESIVDFRKIRLPAQRSGIGFRFLLEIGKTKV